MAPASLTAYAHTHALSAPRLSQTVPAAARDDGTPWTASPWALLLENALALKALLTEARAAVAEVVRTGKADRTLMAQLGARVAALAGFADPAFSMPLPAVGERVAVYQALCPLYAQWLADGGDALSTVFLEALQRAAGLRFVLCNIAFRCWRKGVDGMEPTGGAAGCHCELKQELLDVLADVRKVHLLGLEAAGVTVVCIVAAAQDSIASLIGKAAAKTVKMGVPHAVDAWTLFALQHPKFVFWVCRNDMGVCDRLKILKGDVLLRASKVLELYAKVASAVRELVDGGELHAEVIYMRVREDKAALKAGLVVRSWDDRDETTTDEETSARFDKAQREQRSKAGSSPKTPETLTYEHTVIGLQYLNGATIYVRTATSGKNANRLAIGVKKLEKMSEPADAPMLALIASVRTKKPAQFTACIPGGIKVGGVGTHAIWSAGLKIVSVEIKGTPKAAKPKVPGKPKAAKRARKA